MWAASVAGATDAHLAGCWEYWTEAKTAVSSDLLLVALTAPEWGSLMVDRSALTMVDSLAAKLACHWVAVMAVMRGN